MPDRQKTPPTCKLLRSSQSKSHQLASITAADLEEDTTASVNEVRVCVCGGKDTLYPT